MVLQYSFVVFPQPGASRYVFYASSQCPNWPHILPLFIWRLNKHTKNIFSFLSSSLFPQHKYGKSWTVFKPFLQILFSIFCLAAAQVWKLKHRMARGGLKVFRLTSGSGNPRGEKFLALAGALCEAKVEVFICYRFFELWHNLLLPTHWLSSLLKFQAIMVLSNLCKF